MHIFDAEAGVARHFEKRFFFAFRETLYDFGAVSWVVIWNKFGFSSPSWHFVEIGKNIMMVRLST